MGITFKVNVSVKDTTTNDKHKLINYIKKEWQKHRQHTQHRQTNKQTIWEMKENIKQAKISIVLQIYLYRSFAHSLTLTFIRSDLD